LTEEVWKPSFPCGVAWDEFSFWKQNKCFRAEKGGFLPFKIICLRLFGPQNRSFDLLYPLALKNGWVLPSKMGQMGLFYPQMDGVHSALREDGFLCLGRLKMGRFKGLTFDW
jgi:hypothetical protein